MNLFCHLRENNSFKRIVLSQNLQNELSEYLSNIINKFVNSTQIEFSGEYKPEEENNEILCINDFINPYQNFEPMSLEVLSGDEIENIKSLIFVDDNKIAYQSFDKRKIIKPSKWFLIYSNDTYSKIEKAGLIIDPKIDALYLVKEKKLLFYSFHNATKIFDLADYYREATDSEIENFFDNKLIEKETDFNKEHLNKNVRKKIHLIQKNNILKKVQSNFDEVAKHASKFDLLEYFDINFKKIKIPNDKKKIEKLINFLNDDIYDSPITSNIYKTNSKRVINSFSKKVNKNEY